jgi:hypothetical protein
MKLPVDFEEKVRMPPAINGRSYPYQISARDLMDNFKYAALQVDTTSGLEETTNSDGSRTVKLSNKISGNTVQVLVVENGAFKLGNFYIDGELTPIS